ncbi:MAG: DUF3098 domain-containing protein [Bacteroidota bacterium]
MAQRPKNKKRRSQRAASGPRRSGPARMPFERKNYVLLLSAIALIVAGYALMLIDNAVSDNPVDSALSLTVAPLLLLGGYLGTIWAILTGIGDPENSEAAAPEAAGETVEAA